MRESPKKLKKQALGFLGVLNKYGVTLDSDANPVLEHIEDKNIQKFLKKKEALVRTTLLQADLEFEYPQKLEKILVQSDILRWLDEEEEKLKNIALEEYMDAETKNQSDIKLTPGKQFYLTYDEYYNNRELVAQDTSRIKIGAGGMIEKSLTYEQFVEINKSDNMFDNDLLEQQYKFWETAIEKEQRLKKVWIDMNRSQALGGVDDVSDEQRGEMNEQIIELMRKLRWKVDQQLVRRNKRPIFH